MKKIFKFLFLVAFLLMPAVASAVDCGAHSESAQQCAEYSTNLCTWDGSACVEKCPTEDNTCQHWGGCTYNDDDGCKVCGLNQYNSSNNATSCTPCTERSFREGQQHIYGEWCAPCQHWMCASGYFADGNYNNGQNNINALRASGNCTAVQAGDCVKCPYNNNDDLWYAESVHGSFLASNFNACIDQQSGYTTLCGDNELIKTGSDDGTVYYCGRCGNSGPQQNTRESDTGAYICGCYTHANRVGGTDRDADGKLVECKCPGYSEASGGDCVCQGQRVMVQGSDGLWRCEPCPDNSTRSGDVCECNQNYYKENTDVNEMPICKRCPNGTFKDDSGNVEITACQMDHRTKFCNGNGQNCMQLIP